MWGAELVLFFCYVDFAYKLVLKLTGYPITIYSHSKTSVGLVGPLFRLFPGTVSYRLLVSLNPKPKPIQVRTMIMTALSLSLDLDVYDPVVILCRSVVAVVAVAVVAVVAKQSNL